MKTVLLAGAAMLTLVIAGVVVVFKRDGKAPDVVVSPEIPVAVDELADEAAGEVFQRGDGEFLVLAEPLAKRFLEAESVDELLPLVRHSDQTEARMRAYYPDGRVEPEGLSDFNTRRSVERKGSLAAVRLRTRDFEEKPLGFIDGEDGVKVDWESWVGWSEVPWDDFIAAKSTEPKMFRVVVRPVEYYNFDFKDDRKWKSWSLESPDGGRSLYGYVLEQSLLDEKISLAPEVKKANMMLRLKFPENPATDNQVLIDGHVGDGWLLEDEETR